MIPKTMRYVTHGEGGGPEVLRIVEGQTPEIGPRDVLIQTHFAGVNRPDILQRAGKYPPPLGASPILGLEVAGQVVAHGAEVTTLSITERTILSPRLKRITRERGVDIVLDMGTVHREECQCAGE